MKVELNNIRIAISALEEQCYAGIMSKDNPLCWREKVNVHNDFIHAVITNWKNKKEVFHHDGYEYEISVKVTKLKE
ncbi:MAG TPA: hypothetical protein PLN38_13835 [Chitinophagales bacterium]|nr:hypothetical protein [Chitinophagales bacterium]